MSALNATPDGLHRLVKQAIDSGRAATVADAQARLEGYRLNIEYRPDDAEDPVEQAALLTAVVLAQRVFLGGVRVSGRLGARAVTPVIRATCLSDAVEVLGGACAPPWDDTPTIIIGGGPMARAGFAIRTAVAGWRGGILPIEDPRAPAMGPPMPLAGMLAAALAVNEAFAFVNGDTSEAGHRAQGLSLFDLRPDVDWLVPKDAEPTLQALPQALWLIGLGHLGQAYLWALGLLPYADPGGVHLVLQDIDVITASTPSTSVLSTATQQGRLKTRAMAGWAETRGFRTSLVERRFDASFRRQPEDPPVALCGLDNALGRRALDHAGFDLVVEAGLGRGHQDFRALRLHVLPGPRPAARLWPEGAASGSVEDAPAYRDLLTRGLLDQCGVALLAGKAVGAPFVGAVAGAMAIAELLRLLNGGRLHHVIDLDLMAIEHRTTCVHPTANSSFNPGFVRAL